MKEEGEWEEQREGKGRKLRCHEPEMRWKGSDGG